MEASKPDRLSRAGQLRRVRRLVKLLDQAIAVPGTRISIGLDSIIGLIPGAGDLVTAIAALYIVHQARQLGAPKHVLYRMLANVGIDALVGTIPVLGDIFDVGFKANVRNLKLLERHLPAGD